MLSSVFLFSLCDFNFGLTTISTSYDEMDRKLDEYDGVVPIGITTQALPRDLPA